MGGLKSHPVRFSKEQAQAAWPPLNPRGLGTLRHAARVDDCHPLISFESYFEALREGEVGMGRGVRGHVGTKLSGSIRNFCFLDRIRCQEPSDVVSGPAMAEMMVVALAIFIASTPHPLRAACALCQDRSHLCCCRRRRCRTPSPSRSIVPHQTGSWWPPLRLSYEALMQRGAQPFFCLHLIFGTATEWGRGPLASSLRLDATDGTLSVLVAPLSFFCWP